MKLIYRKFIFGTFIIAFVITALISCGSKSEGKKTTQTTQQGGRLQQPQNIDVIIATPQKINESIEVPGSLVASETTEIHPEVSGRLTMLKVREGAYVGKSSLNAKL